MNDVCHYIHFMEGNNKPSGNSEAHILGMAVGLAAMLAIWSFSDIAFTWYVLIGTVVTFVTGYAASLCFKRPPDARDLR